MIVHNLSVSVVYAWVYSSLFYKRVYWVSLRHESKYSTLKSYRFQSAFFAFLNKRRVLQWRIGCYRLLSLKAMWGSILPDDITLNCVSSCFLYTYLKTYFFWPFFFLVYFLVFIFDKLAIAIIRVANFCLSLTLFWQSAPICGCAALQT